MAGRWMAVFLLVAGCGDGRGGGSSTSQETAVAVENPYGLTAADTTTDAAAGAAGQASKADAAMPAAPAAALPRIAYAYALQYRLPGDKLAAAQAAHLKMCDALGAARCRLVVQTRSDGDGEFVSGQMAFDVDSRVARDFADRMDRAVAGTGGSATGRSVSAEDLSKQIIDVSARIRAKQALADRLLDLIRNRNGKVGELVEAERAFAQAQEELDAARSGLEAMQRRVAMSRIDASYRSIGIAGGGALDPVGEAVASAGQTLGRSLGLLIAFAVAALPWGLLLALVVLGVRRLRRGRAKA